MARTKLQKKLSRENTIKWFNDYRMGCKCAVCGESHWATLDFHHIDPSTKTNAVPTIAAKGTFGQLQREIEKCVALCSNCHRKLHMSDPNLFKDVISKSKGRRKVFQVQFLRLRHLRAGEC